MSLGIPKRWGTRVREAPCHLLRCLFSLAHSDLASECGVLLLLREAGLTPQVPVASSAIVLSSQDDSLPKGTRGSPPRGPLLHGSLIPCLSSLCPLISSSSPFSFAWSLPHRPGGGQLRTGLISEFQPLFAAGWFSQAWLP